MCGDRSVSQAGRLGALDDRDRPVDGRLPRPPDRGWIDDHAVKGRQDRCSDLDLEVLAVVPPQQSTAAGHSADLVVPVGATDARRPEPIAGAVLRRCAEPRTQARVSTADTSARTSTPRIAPPGRPTRPGPSPGLRVSPEAGLGDGEAARAVAAPTGRARSRPSDPRDTGISSKARASRVVATARTGSVSGRRSRG